MKAERHVLKGISYERQMCHFADVGQILVQPQAIKGQQSQLNVVRFSLAG